METRSVTFVCERWREMALRVLAMAGGDAGAPCGDKGMDAAGARM
jgi:hypothetical protein